MVSPKASSSRRNSHSGGPYPRNSPPRLPPETSSCRWSTGTESIHEPLIDPRRGPSSDIQQNQAPLFGAGGGSNTSGAGIPPVAIIVLFAGMLLFAFTGGLVLAGRMSRGNNEGTIDTAGTEYFSGLDHRLLSDIERELINEGAVPATSPAAAAVPSKQRGGRKGRVEEMNDAQMKLIADIQEKELQLIKTARELDDAEDANLKGYFDEAFGKFTEAIDLEPEGFVVAREELFDKILDGLNAPGALVWMLAHWNLNQMSKEWREWTEINIAQGSSEEDIIKVYQEMLPNREAVDGIVRTFEMWEENNWRLAVPDAQKQLAAHSEAAALKRDREIEAALLAEEEEDEDEEYKKDEGDEIEEEEDAGDEGGQL